MVCCNPFGKHECPVTKGLHLITDVQRKQCSFLKITDKFWCDTCRKHKHDMLSDTFSTLQGNSAHHSAFIYLQYHPQFEVRIKYFAAGVLGEGPASANIEGMLLILSSKKRKKILLWQFLHLPCSSVPESHIHEHGVANITVSQDVCCNPFGKHEDPVIQGLRLITEVQREQCSFPNVTDRFWCDACHKHNHDMLSGSLSILPGNSAHHSAFLYFLLP